MKSLEYKLCVDCGAAFELDRSGGGCPTLKRRNSKSKKRYDDRHDCRCPLCRGMMVHTTDEQERERDRTQQEVLNRVERENTGESVAGILRRAYGH